MGWFTTEDIIDDGDSYIIKSFPIGAFTRALKKQYKTTKLGHLYKSVGIKIFGGKNTHNIRIHKFFIPELVYLLKKFYFPTKLIDSIIDKTWFKYTITEPTTSRVKLSRISKGMSVKLHSYQKEFIELYDIKRQQAMLNGYLLSFDQGLGKTLTSLALMESLGKKTVVVVAPKSTLESVWVHHIETFFKEKKVINVVNQGPLSPDADFIIVNYESMNKLDEITSQLNRRSDEVGIIIDESHNFLRSDSGRTKGLIKLRRDTNCKDMLLMSGTPLKAVGLELIPMLMVLDGFFDETAMKLFKKSFGVNTTIATDVLKARLSSMMHRKLKDDVIKLPPKTEQVIKVKIPNGDMYKLSTVKTAVKVFTKERLDFHGQKMGEYIAVFDEVMNWARANTKLAKDPDFRVYLQHISYMRRVVVDMRNEKDREMVQWVNKYEKNVILPALSKDMKKKMNSVKSAVKYVHMKVKGEVIGRLLMSLRMKMTSDMVANYPIEDIINDATKKTVIFTSYVDTVETALDALREKGFNPVAVYGKTMNNVKMILNKFRTNDKVNPLIASIQTLSTGVTIIEANTMIFLNKPWRHVEYLQASDRIHRIGQDTACTIISLVLDTGSEENLSTRMEDVMTWSKEMFEGMVSASIV